MLPFGEDSEEGVVELSVFREKLGVPAPASGAAVSGGRQKKGEELPGSASPDNAAPAKAAQSQKASAALGHNGGENTAGLENDEIDLIIQEELGNWRPLIDPLVNPIVRLLEQCGSYEEFYARLPEAMQEQDATVLARALSFAMFEQRVKGESDG